MTKYQDINDFMADCGTKIRHAARDTVIRERFGPFGFDGARHDATISLYEETVALIGRHKEGLTEWLAACNAFYNSLHEAKKQFCLLRSRLKYWYSVSAREAVALDLYNDRIYTYNGFIESAEVFYGNLLQTTEALEKLERFGYRRELIKEQKTNLDQLRLLRENRGKEANRSPVSLDELNDPTDRLHESAGEITWLAKLAFQENEAHYLEKLGVISRT